MTRYPAFFLAIALGIVVPLRGQAPGPDSVSREAGPQRTAEQLDQLLSPIALYPDALIALILPAATVPSDVVLAARYLNAKGDPAQIDNQPWDDSAKALAHYPEVVKWMDENLAWTKQLGEAFTSQPAEVMKSVQRRRAQARSVGTLTTTPQQQVIVDGNDISIVPAQPDIIYVPRYDPEIVYVDRPAFYSEPYLTFGTGYPAGLWLVYDLDWGHRRIWIDERHERREDWREHRDWRRPVFPEQPGYVSDPNRHPWRPPPPHSRPLPAESHPSHIEVVRPSTLPGTPPRPPGWQGNPVSRPVRDRNLEPGNPIGNHPAPVGVMPAPPPPVTAQTPPPDHANKSGHGERSPGERERIDREPHTPSITQPSPPATPQVKSVAPAAPTPPAQPPPVRPPPPPPHQTAPAPKQPPPPSTPPASDDQKKAEEKRE